MTTTSTIAPPPRRSGSPRWSARCVLALAVFQVVIAILLFINRNEAAGAFAGHGFAPTPAAARGAVLGGLVMHLLLAVLSGFLAHALPRGRRVTRILGTILLAVIAVGGIGAMALPSQTYLSPIGVALAVGGLALIWLPFRR
jgi:hypothetical protein